MEDFEEKVKLAKIFEPGLGEAVATAFLEDRRFVYYTSADAAMKIVPNGELWFRNAAVITDLSEMSYGLKLINTVFSGAEGNRFREIVENIFPGTMNKAIKLLDVWKEEVALNTYIACVSIHNPEEDQYGRLSMWRAYGDTAIVMNLRPLLEMTELKGTLAIPVRYLSEVELTDHLAKVTNKIQVMRKFLHDLGQECLVDHILEMLFRFAIATKHPGFEEEKEWRLVYRPEVRENAFMTEGTVVLGGVLQKIYKLRLADEPDKGFDGVDIPPLLERIIIGPSEFPNVTFRAFVDLLSGGGVEDAASKVVLSDLPVRVSA